jgi:hypothetical protein
MQSWTTARRWSPAEAWIDPDRSRLQWTVQAIGLGGGSDAEQLLAGLMADPAVVAVAAAVWPEEDYGRQ